jgi:hypothetical protein
MVTLYVLAGLAFCFIFILFLVMSKTLNAISNHLIELQYFVQKEIDFHREQQAINQLMEEDRRVPPSENNDKL